MKITNIRTTTLKAPLKNPFITSLRRVDALKDLVVIIECDDGSTGYGEGAPTPVITGETLGSMIATIEYIKPHLIGLEIEDFETILKSVHSLIIKNTTAKSALEIALYDLKAKSFNQPLYKMLGGRKTKFKTDITISMGEIDKMISDSLNAVNLGYDTLKIKIGDNPQKDIERIIAINDALDESITLRLDANQGWTEQESVELLHARVQTPLLADESIFSLKDARRLLDIQAIDYVNIKLAKTAGITEALKLADLSAEFGVKCMIGCMLEGPISVAAGVHVASAKADIITMLDLDAVSLLASNPVQTNIIFNESEIILSEDAGIGVSYTPAIN